VPGGGVALINRPSRSRQHRGERATSEPECCHRQARARRAAARYRRERRHGRRGRRIDHPPRLQGAEQAEHRLRRDSQLSTATWSSGASSTRPRSPARPSRTPPRSRDDPHDRGADHRLPVRFNARAISTSPVSRQIQLRRCHQRSPSARHLHASKQHLP
jgi:hypothetical protein